MSLTRVSHRRKGQTHLFAFYPYSAAPSISRRHQPCTPRFSPLSLRSYLHYSIRLWFIVFCGSEFKLSKKLSNFFDGGKGFTKVTERLCVQKIMHNSNWSCQTLFLCCRNGSKDSKDPSFFQESMFSLIVLLVYM